LQENVSFLNFTASKMPQKDENMNKILTKTPLQTIF
jgi:hypothetical protein